jgi:outer membrane protein OmpA-like peptidoglycan-associated protein
MQLVAALLILLVAVVGGTFVLPVWPDAMSKLGLVEHDEWIEDPKPKLSTGAEIPQSEPTEVTHKPFDVAKIAPNGTSVFAGQSTPNAAVTVFADGEVVGTANTDQNGEWVLIVERRFASADPKLAVQLGPIKPPAQAPSPILAEAPSFRASSASAQLMNELQHRVEQARAQAERFASAKSETIVDADAQKTSDGTLPLTQTGTPPATGAPAVTGARDIVPVPINFVFRKAEFTEEGTKAANLLLQYLLLRQPPFISMTGHADERGTSAFNMTLSSDRLEAVAAFLRAGGYTGQVELIPKGDWEPFAGVDRSVVPREQLYDLDRRVELHVSE